MAPCVSGISYFIPISGVQTSVVNDKLINWGLDKYSGCIWGSFRENIVTASYSIYLDQYQHEDGTLLHNQDIHKNNNISYFPYHKIIILCWV